jgi:hypothetical protein
MTDRRVRPSGHDRRSTIGRGTTSMRLSVMYSRCRSALRHVGLLLSLAGLVACDQAREAERLLASAEKARHKGQLTLAADRYHRAAGFSPQDVAIRYRAACLIYRPKKRPNSSSQMASPPGLSRGAGYRSSGVLEEDLRAHALNYGIPGGSAKGMAHVPECPSSRKMSHQLRRSCGWHPLAHAAASERLDNGIALALASAWAVRFTALYR